MDLRELGRRHADALLSLTALAGTQDGVVARSDVLRAGATPQLLRSTQRRGEWLSLLRGTGLLETWRTGRRSWARSAQLVLPGAVLAKRTAAALLDLPTGPRDGRVHVARAGEMQVGGRPLAVHRWSVPPGQVVDLDGLRMTSRARTAPDVVLGLERPDALAVLDALRRPRRWRARLCAGRRGAGRVLDVWDIVDGRAETPLESRARLRCHEGGVAPDDLQVDVRDEHGHLLARADMDFRHRRSSRPGLLLLEADGKEPHSSPEAVYRDRWRTDALVALGHDVIRCTWRDTLSATAVPTMVRRAL